MAELFKFGRAVPLVHPAAELEKFGHRRPDSSRSQPLRPIGHDLEAAPTHAPIEHASFAYPTDLELIVDDRHVGIDAIVLGDPRYPRTSRVRTRGP